MPNVSNLHDLIVALIAGITLLVTVASLVAAPFVMLTEARRKNKKPDQHAPARVDWHAKGGKLQ